MKGKPAASPHQYVEALDGWQRQCVTGLRDVILRTSTLHESIKWGHLVYESRGPVLLVRAEDTRVLFGFWRGRRLVEIEPRLKPGGKYEMATMAITQNDAIDSYTVARLVEAAVTLNEEHGDPRE